MAKTANLRIGIKGVEPITVPVQLAENPSELLSLARQNAEVVVRWGNRGLRIEAQERSGARDKLREVAEANGGKIPDSMRESLKAELTKLVADFDPTQAAARGGPRTKTVSIKQAPGKRLSMDEFLAQLAAQGVKVNIDNAEQPAAAGAGA